MKLVNGKTSLMLRLGITATALLIGQQAMALGTDPGIVVTNTANVDYEVGGIGQPTEVSNAADFVVDRRVDFTVTRMGAALTLTTLSDTDGFLDFFVTNLSNGDLDFNLLFTQLVFADGIIYVAGTEDTTGAAEDMFNVRIRVSAAPDPFGVPGGGAAPLLSDGTFIDNLPEDFSIRVRIYADTVAVAANGLVSGLSLDATAADPVTTVNLLQTPGLDDPTLLENVFADGGLDNAESDSDGFLLQAAQLIVTKTATVIFDPFGSDKAVPGAVIEYVLEIDNSAGAVSATAMSISDVIDPNVTFLSGVYNGGASNVSIFDGVATTTFCDAETGGADTNADGCVYDPPAVGMLTIGGMDQTGPFVPLVVPAGAIFTVSFQVEIPLT